MANIPNPANRRYVQRLAICMAMYLVSLVVAVSMRNAGTLHGAIGWLVALIPGLAVAGIFWAIGRLIVEQEDEYLRSLIVRQSLIASGFALCVITIWGFLENFGLVRHVDGFYVAVLWFIGFGIGACWNKVRGA